MKKQGLGKILHPSSIINTYIFPVTTRTLSLFLVIAKGAFYGLVGDYANDSKLASSNIICNSGQNKLLQQTLQQCIRHWPL
jgi:hypothetical protein